MSRLRLRWFYYAGILLGIAILVAVFLPAPLTFGPAKRATCMLNLKGLATSFEIYASDNSEAYPQENWADATYSFRKTDDQLTCPVVEQSRKKFGYALNLAVLGKKTPHLDGKTPLLFETDALGRNVVANLAARNLDRHKREYSNVSYVDGHARMIRAGESP